MLSKESVVRGAATAQETSCSTAPRSRPL